MNGGYPLIHWQVYVDTIQPKRCRPEKSEEKKHWEMLRLVSIDTTNGSIDANDMYCKY